MKGFRLFLLLACSSLPTGSLAGTIYVDTKLYPWEWGKASWDFDSGSEQLRAWLEAKKPPRLLDAPKELRREIARRHKLDRTVTVKYAVLAPPRSSNGHNPYFFVWVEWVTRSKFAFDLQEKRMEREAGIARVALEGAGERTPELRDWHFEKDLREADLQALFPWDAAVIARKMLDFHAARPRQAPEKAAGPGMHSRY